MAKKLLLSLLAAALTAPVATSAGYTQDYPVAGYTTEYYTKITPKLSRFTCRMEGNQITNGILYGSNCKPIEKYCRWGMGARGNCLIPCVDGAGRRSWLGKTVRIPPRVCKYGPFAGKTIRYLRISDVGSAVQGSHVDIFQGICLRTSKGVCREFGDESQYASYRGTNQYDDTQSTVVALLNQMNPVANAAPATPARQQYAEAQTGTVMR